MQTLAEIIAWRHRMTGEVSGHSFDSQHRAHPHHYKPLVYVATFPAWLTVGATLRPTTESDSRLRVLEVDPLMCLVRSGEYTHAVETDVLVRYWRVEGEDV